MPNLVGNSTSWAIYFLLYDIAKRSASTLHGGSIGLTYADYFLASGTAGMVARVRSTIVLLIISLTGIFTAIITNPIWVLKTRLLSTPAGHSAAYTSATQGMQQIYKKDGLSGFYRGLTPSLFGVSHGALQFMIYEQMKIIQQSRLPPDENLGNVDYLFFSGLSKVFAGTVTYPYQVLRSRLQTYDAETTYKGTIDVIQQVWKKEGIKGFYKGLAPNLLRVVPSSCITFLVYENCRTYLPAIFS